MVVQALLHEHLPPAVEAEQRVLPDHYDVGVSCRNIDRHSSESNINRRLPQHQPPIRLNLLDGRHTL